MLLAKVLLLNDGAANPQLTKDHRKPGEYGGHADEAEIRWRDESGQDGGNHELAHLLSTLR